MRDSCLSQHRMGRRPVPGEAFGIKREPCHTTTMTGSGSMPRQLTHRGMLAITLAGRPRDGPRAQTTGLEPRAHLFAAQLTSSFSLALDTSAARERLQHACTAGKESQPRLRETADRAPGKRLLKRGCRLESKAENGGGEKLTNGAGSGQTPARRASRASPPGRTAGCYPI